MEHFYCQYHGQWDGHPQGVRMQYHRIHVKQQNTDIRHWFECPCCGNKTPPAETFEKACSNASHRFEPSGRPFTPEQFEALRTPFSAWIEYEGGALQPVIITACNAGEDDEPPTAVFLGVYDVTTQYLQQYNSVWRVWAKQPTEDERKAARWKEK